MTGAENNVHKRLIAYQDIANTVHLINDRINGCGLNFKEDPDSSKDQIQRAITKELQPGLEFRFSKDTDSNINI